MNLEDILPIATMPSPEGITMCRDRSECWPTSRRFVKAREAREGRHCLGIVLDYWTCQKTLSASTPSSCGSAPRAEVDRVTRGRGGRGGGRRPARRRRNVREADSAAQFSHRPLTRQLRREQYRSGARPPPSRQGMRESSLNRQEWDR